MRTIFSLWFCFFAPAMAQQTNNDQPTEEFLEFLAEFNMQSENDDEDYDIIQHHALQDLKAHPLQEKNNDN